MTQFYSSEEHEKKGAAFRIIGGKANKPSSIISERGGINTPQKWVHLLSLGLQHCILGDGPQFPIKLLQGIINIY